MHKKEERLRVTVILTGEAARIMKKISRGQRSYVVNYAIREAYVLGKLDAFLNWDEEESENEIKQEEKRQEKQDKDKKESFKFLEELEEKFGL